MYQTAPSIWTIGRDKPIILGVPFLSHTGPIKKPRGVAKPGFHLCISCFSKYSQTSFCPRTLLQISNLDELVFGPYRYLFCRVPPQPNCPPADVPAEASKQCQKGWVVLQGRSVNSGELTSTLLPILCTLLNITTTSCSKGPQGLCFPLGDDGIFTIK